MNRCDFRRYRSTFIIRSISIQKLENDISRLSSQFDDYWTLTSHGVQKRYFEAVSRRKNVNAVKEYFLLSEQESEKYTNLSVVLLYPENTLEIVEETPFVDSPELMSTLTTQSIVKESRVKESIASSDREDEASSSDDDSLNILKIYSSNIEAPTKEVERKLNTWLTVFDAVIIQETITRTQLSGKSFNYLNAILNDFKRKQVKTLDDIALMMLRLNSLNKDLINTLLSRNPYQFGHPQITQPMLSRLMKPRTKSLNPVLKG